MIRTKLPALACVALSAVACSGKSTTTVKPAPSASAAALALPTASSTPSKPPLAPSRPPGPSAEKVLEEARAHVAEAEKLAGGGKEVCAEVLPLLDVSYAMTRGSTTIDEKTLAVFAKCAMRAQRWRLLRDLGDAIAAGERKLETTYFIPRALLGQGDYEQAFVLSKATLRAWPTEGEAYDTAALAALRVKDWDGAVKAADQALLLQRKHNANDDVTALAHAVRGSAALRMGKIEEGLHEVESTRGHEGVLVAADITLEAAKVAKAHALLVTVDTPSAVYPALASLYGKRTTPLGAMVTVTLQNLSDRPQPVLVEVTLAGAEAITESETVVKGKPLTLLLDPKWKAGSPLESPKAPEAHELVVSVTGGAEHGVLYREQRSLTFEPRDALPKTLRSHGEDLRSAFPLEAAWVTPKAPPIVALVDAAKARLKAAPKEGAAGPTLPLAQAVWDELRGRGVSFRRDPKIDSEARTSEACVLPSQVLARGEGDALESSLLFASLLEAMGLDVVLVETPGHRMVGWLGSAADIAAEGATPALVKSSLGEAYFLETTTVGEGPFDAAVLRGDATWVAAVNDKSVATGRVQVERLSELRRRGIGPRVE